jgi:hypothetical protein
VHVFVMSCFVTYLALYVSRRFKKKVIGFNKTYHKHANQSVVQPPTSVLLLSFCPLDFQPIVRSTQTAYTRNAQIKLRTKAVLNRKIVHTCLLMLMEMRRERL